MRSASAYTDSVENAMTALRGLRRASLQCPSCASVESRGRPVKRASGTSVRISGRMVSAPRNMVSAVPRARRSRSVKTWPRSRSPAS